MKRHFYFTYLFHVCTCGQTTEGDNTDIQSIIQAVLLPLLNDLGMTILTGLLTKHLYEYVIGNLLITCRSLYSLIRKYHQKENVFILHIAVANEVILTDKGLSLVH